MNFTNIGGAGRSVCLSEKCEWMSAYASAWMRGEEPGTPVMLSGIVARMRDASRSRFYLIDIDDQTIDAPGGGMHGKINGQTPANGAPDIIRDDRACVISEHRKH